MQSIMQEQEGVIKYQLNHQHHTLTQEIDVAELNAWRSVFYQLKLIGQMAEKYGGLGFGNISRRLVPGSEQFVISGSQTGQLESLSLQQYALVRAANLHENQLDSCGHCPPSSEALTHACVYQQLPAIQAVIHVHSPEIWLSTEKLALASTAANIPYGTVEMAVAVATLFNSDKLANPGAFSMLGHIDGIVSFGPSLADAAMVLIKLLVKARS